MRASIEYVTHDHHFVALVSVPIPSSEAVLVASER